MRKIVLALLVFAACAGRIPLPEQYRAANAQDLYTRMQKAQSPVRAFSAEARLAYFGKQGRMRGNATLVVRRPGSLRYDVYGPHGGVISAFATNGKELALLDVGQSRFLYGPATAANLDELLPFAPLGLGPDAWVALLFGEATVPPEATLTYDDRVGRFLLSWPAAGVTQRLEVDPESARIVRAVVLRGEDTVSEVTIDARDDAGVPTALRIKVPRENIDVDVALKDVTVDPELEDDVFVLSPPAGVTPERL